MNGSSHCWCFCRHPQLTSGWPNNQLPSFSVNKRSDKRKKEVKQFLARKNLLQESQCLPSEAYNINTILTALLATSCPPDSWKFTNKRASGDNGQDTSDLCRKHCYLAVTKPGEVIDLTRSEEDRLIAECSLLIIRSKGLRHRLSIIMSDILGTIFSSLHQPATPCGHRFSDVTVDGKGASTRQWEAKSHWN